MTPPTTATARHLAPWHRPPVRAWSASNVRTVGRATPRCAVLYRGPDQVGSVAQLVEQAHVVATRPVLDDHPVGYPPQVDERPRRRTARRDPFGEQLHRRGS